MAVRENGVVVLPGAIVRRCLLAAEDRDWNDFAMTWERLPRDLYMGDGGAYRRRKYAVIALEDSKLSLEPRQPHYQATEHNWLNGGVERWYAPIDPLVWSNPILGAALDAARLVLERAFAVEPLQWRVQLHQFRIEAHEGAPGFPTPEGVHRDGAEGGFVMLIRRENVSGGETTFFDVRKQPLAAFTLTDAAQSVIFDDRRVFHAVSPIWRIDARTPGLRDALVATFHRRD